MSTRRYLCFILTVIIFTSCQNNETINSSEDFGELIPFRSFLQSNVFFQGSSTAFIVLRNKDNEQAFVDTMINGGWVFPGFSYEDSMLVGIILGRNPDIGLPAASSDSFSIDSLLAYADTIKVHSHLFLPKIRTDDVVSLSHFIVIPKTDKIFQFMNIAYIYEDPY